MSNTNKITFAPTATARSVITEYGDGTRAHSATPAGAIRAAFRRLLARMQTHCTVWVPADLIAAGAQAAGDKTVAAELKAARAAGTWASPAGTEYVLVARMKHHGPVTMLSTPRLSHGIDTLWYCGLDEAALYALGRGHEVNKAAAHRASLAAARAAAKAKAKAAAST